MAESKPLKELPSRPHSAPTQVQARKIRVIGVPLDLGQSRRGVDMGPSAVRVAGLEAKLEALGLVVEDGGNIAVPIAETKKHGNPNALTLDIGASKLSQGCSAQTCLVEIERHDGPAPAVTAHDLPRLVSRDS